MNNKVFPSRLFFFSLILILTFSAFYSVVPTKAQSPSTIDRETISQYSTLGALAQGFYDGEMTVGELKKLGDIGLGTFNALDGEMVMLDGNIYQVPVSGEPRMMADTEKIPFAAVTYFDQDVKKNIENISSLKDFTDKLNAELGDPNLFLVFKVQGVFDYVKTRSVPRQQKPYIPLAEVVKSQAVFELKNIEGTLVGFRCPQWIGDLNAAGYHLHFISKDGKHGGHVLDLNTKQAAVEVDQTFKFSLSLPQMDSFHDFQLGKASD